MGGSRRRRTGRGRVDAPDARGCIAVGQQAQIAAAPYRDIAPQRHGRGHGDLHDAACRRRHRARLPAEVGDAIAVVPDGINARVVREAALHQYLERPKRFGRDGVAGGAVEARRHAAGIFNGGYGAARVFAEFGGRERRNQAVRIAVAADLVPRGGDGARHFRVPLGHPAKHEEGGPDGIVVEQREHRAGLRAHTGRKGRPPGGRSSHLRGVEVLFHIDAERVRDPHPRARLRSLSTFTAPPKTSAKKHSTTVSTLRWSIRPVPVQVQCQPQRSRVSGAPGAAESQ